MKTEFLFLMLAGLALYLMRQTQTQAAAYSSSVGVSTDNIQESGNALDVVLGPVYDVQNVFSQATGGRMNLSSAGMDLLKRNEGFRSTVYLDEAGLETIGYGHQVNAGESFGVVTEADAEALLVQDVGDAENAVNSLVTAPITQPQFDALVSFVYNVGAGKFRASTLLARVNAGDPDAAAEFSRWVYVTQPNGVKTVNLGLAARRQREILVFAGNYNGGAA